MKRETHPRALEGTPLAQRFEVFEPLGAGGTATVFRAWDRANRRWVALRFGPCPPWQDPGHHPGVALMSEQIGEEAALSRIVDGLPLDRPEVDWLARWGNAGFATVVTRLLEATGWFHAHLGLHRDISPANMMIGLDPDGSPRPCLLDPSSRENSALFGSIFVMSPEQFDRRPLDARSDLYSLGITLYFAASGRFPFYGDTAIALALAHLHDLPDLSPLARLPAAWAKWLTTRLMAKKPGDRPDSATHAWCEWMRLAGGNQAGHWRGVL